MPQLAQTQTAVRPPLSAGTDADAARRSLRDQIARLERELSRTFAGMMLGWWRVRISSGCP